MARWIYGFREAGSRELTEAERAALRARCRRARWGAAGVGFVVVIFFFASIAAIAAAVEQPALGIPLLIACAVVGIWISSKIAPRENLALMYRRAARIGVARAWTRDEAPAHVREAYTNPRSQEDEDDVPRPEGWVQYWEIEERFDQELERVLGRPAQWFETINDDTVVLTVEGKTATRVIHAPMVTVKEP